MKILSKMSERELRSELGPARELLAEAKCPNECIDGVVSKGRLRENWYRCPFCGRREQLIGD